MINDERHGFNLVGAFQAMGDFFKEVKNSDPTKFQEVWDKNVLKIAQEMGTAISDKKITSVPSENATSAADKVVSASATLSPRTKDEARKMLQEKIKNLDIKLNALATLANLVPDTPNAYAQTKSIRKSLSDSIYKCQQANYLAIEHGLSAEIESFERLQDHFSSILAQLPKPPQVTVDAPFETQFTELWHKLDSYYNQTMKGLETVGVMQSHLDEADSINAKKLPSAEKEEQKEKLADARKLIDSIKPQLLKFSNEFDELSKMAGPSVVDQLNNQLDMALDEGESLRGRYATQADSIRNLETPSTQLRLYYNDYTKNAIQLIERQEKALDNALELKNILKEYKELNTTFSKQLDSIDSMVKEIHDEGVLKELDATVAKYKNIKMPRPWK